MHTPIFLKNITLEFPGKFCFADFSADIQPGSRIFIIGNNGSGKSSLLKIIRGELQPASGEVLNNQNIAFGFVPQLVQDFAQFSGGEKFNKALSRALSARPDVLLLDEPTNHLDARNRKSLRKMLEFYSGTLIVVSHDEEFLRDFAETIWHIDNGKVKIFHGKYSDYRNSQSQKRQSIEQNISQLRKEKKATHKTLMREQQRAKKSKEHGEKMVEQKRWLPVLAHAKQSSAQNNAGRKQKDIFQRKDSLQEQLAELYLPKIIRPSFSLSAQYMGARNVLAVSRADIGYAGKIILRNVNLSLSGGERLGIVGDNGSGKTTLFRAILDDPEISKTGEWTVPKNIGYLDQHYGTLEAEKTVAETIAELRPELPARDIRSILNDFLFRENTEVEKKVALLSGGEKARLSLAKIAVNTPQLLLLDELTNNIDLETKEHCAQVLREYPGAMLIISHDRAFLENIGIENFYELKSQ